MLTCRFYTDDGKAFTEPVESLPEEGQSVDLGGRRHVVRSVTVLSGRLPARFGHAAVVYCSVHPAHDGD
jgi:hypothetical protein